MQPSFSTRTILLAEDDPDDVLLLQLALKKMPLIIDLKHEFTAEMLLKRLEKEVPDMLFLDIQLPGINGISCLIEIRKIEACNNLPVIMYSSSTLTDHIDQSYSRGANYYIIKPNSVEVLIEQLKKIFIIDWESTIRIPLRSSFVLKK